MATQTRGGRTVILQGAVRLFTQVGYHGASVRDIARECDVTVPAIYYHFETKQAILQEIMVTVLTEVIAETRGAVLAAGNRPEQQLAAIVRTWVLFHTWRQPEALIGASELRSLDEEGRRRIVALRDEQENLFRGVIQRGVAEGAFRTPYPREAARAIVTMGRSVADWYHIGGKTSPEETAEQYAEFAVALVGAAT